MYVYVTKQVARDADIEAFGLRPLSVVDDNDDDDENQAKQFAVR